MFVIWRLFKGGGGGGGGGRRSFMIGMLFNEPGVSQKECFEGEGDCFYQLGDIVWTEQAMCEKQTIIENN